jgi:hypothetical protein
LPWPCLEVVRMSYFKAIPVPSWRGVVHNACDH